MESVGAAPVVRNEDGKLVVRSVTNCPFDAIVPDHPEVCGLAASFLSEVTGLNMKEHCQRGELPKCSFEAEADS